MTRSNFDEQLQSSLFGLPAEIRALIYREVLLSGADVQRVSAHYERYKGLFFLRAPCVRLTDKQWVKHRVKLSMENPFLPKRKLADILEDLVEDPDRHTRMHVVTKPHGLHRQQINDPDNMDTADSFRSQTFDGSAGGSLRPPSTLLLTCRKIYLEAAHLSYCLYFSDSQDLKKFLESSPVGILDRVRFVECSWILASKISPFDRQTFQVICGRLSNLRALTGLKINLVPQKHGYPISMPPEWIRMMSNIRRPRLDVHLLGDTINHEEIIQVSTQHGPFIVRRIREPGWVHGREELAQRGLEAFDGIHTKYDMGILRAG